MREYSLYLREGCRKKNEKKNGVALSLKKIDPYVFFENEPLMCETNFTLGPIQKSLYLILLYQFTFAHNRPKSDISGALGPIHYITLKAFAMTHVH